MKVEKVTLTRIKSHISMAKLCTYTKGDTKVYVEHNGKVALLMHTQVTLRNIHIWLKCCEAVILDTPTGGKIITSSEEALNLLSEGQALYSNDSPDSDPMEGLDMASLTVDGVI